MKQWKKPEILDINITLTETYGVMSTSGDLQPIPKWLCPDCETIFDKIDDFYIPGNHKEGCSMRKGARLGPIKVIQ